MGDGSDASGANIPELGPVEMARMRAQRNVLYHAMREAHFSRLTNASNIALVTFAVVLSWASTVGNDPGLIPALGAMVLFVAALSIMADPAGSMRYHALQRLRFALLDRDLQLGRDPRSVEAEFAELYGSEPGTMHALNAIAYNAVQMSHGRSPATILSVTWLERLGANWIAFRPDRFRPVG